MKLSQDKHNFTIGLSGIERLVAFHFGSEIVVPFNTIAALSTAKPDLNWRVIRAPGTSIPGVVTAGTYYTELGREFWWIDRGQKYLVIKLRSGYYKRIILTTAEHLYWAEVLQQSIAEGSS